MQIKFDVAIKNVLGEQLKSITEAFSEAIEAQLNHAEQNIDAFLKTFNKPEKVSSKKSKNSKKKAKQRKAEILDIFSSDKPEKEKFNAKDAKNQICDLLRCLYFSEINLELITAMENQANLSHTKEFDRYVTLIAKMQEKFDDSDSDSETNNNIADLIEKYLNEVFVKTPSNTTFIESYLLKLMEKSITTQGIQNGLYVFVLNQALNIIDFFAEHNKMMVIPRELNFPKVVKTFKENIKTAALDKSSQVIVNIYTDLAEAVQNFKSFKPWEYYPLSKHYEIEIARDAVAKIKSTQSLNVLYGYSQLYVNTHRNPILDYLFGKKNTKSWQRVASEIRAKAFVCLKIEVAQIDDPDAQLEYLKAARNMPVFCEHRNNYIITGAFFRTTTVKEIDKLIESLEKSQKLNTEWTPLIIV